MLEIRDLRVGYGHIEVVHGVSLDVKDGEFVVVLGANGAGKSTLLRACSGLLRPRSGHVLFDDVDISRVAPFRAAGLGVGYAMEGRRVFQRQSVESNLELGAYPLRKQGKRARVPQMFERIYALFPVLKAKGKLLAGTMSGGERQMLAIAQALMCDPKLLLLDEPSAGLAPRLVSDVFTALGHLRADGLSLLLAEQTVEDALALCDRGYVLEAGSVVLAASAAELRQNESVSAIYIGSLGHGAQSGTKPGVNDPLRGDTP
jgi:branched-chain amino acid transport system ATP-binding protein